MLPESPLNVALVLHTYMEENIYILKGIAEYERLHANWRFFLDDRAVSATNPEWLLNQDWAGIICRHEEITLLEECRNRGIPCVDLGSLPPHDPADKTERLPGIPKLRPNDRTVGHVAAEHLMNRGYDKFGFCGFSNDSWAKERRRGFVEAVEAVGYECIVFESYYPGMANPEWHAREVMAIGKWLQSLPHIPCGIMACNDLRGHQVADATMEFGIAVPDEIAIIGANNEAVRAELTHIPLSSVPVNGFDWGFRAAECLHSLIVGQPTDEVCLIDPLPVVQRRSTDALAVEDPIIARALQIIREEACSSIRVDDLAKRVHASRSLLEKKFRLFLRRTPSEEIRNVRITRAKKLLLNTDKTLAEIAYETGFEYPEYLSVMFKRLTGDNPRDFRKRHCPEARIERNRTSLHID